MRANWNSHVSVNQVRKDTKGTPGCRRSSWTRQLLIVSQGVIQYLYTTNVPHIAKTVRAPESPDALAGEMAERSRMEPEGYMLELDRTQLLFIPPLDHVGDSSATPGTVVQICIRGDHGDGYMRSPLKRERC